MSTRTTFKINQDTYSGLPCSDCGKSYEACSVAVLKPGGVACCSGCRNRETHDERHDLVTFAPHEPAADIDGLRAENATLRDRLESQAEGMRVACARFEAAEARVIELRDTLALRSEAVNRTGADNDRLRATIARVEALVKEWERRADKAHSTAMARHGLSDEAALFAFADTVRHRIADVREALATQEPARD